MPMGGDEQRQSGSLGSVLRKAEHENQRGDNDSPPTNTDHAAQYPCYQSQENVQLVIHPGLLSDYFTLF